MCHEYGHIAGMIAWCRVLLFVRSLMFFVDDDQSEISKGQKHRRAHAENQRIGFFAQLPLPHFHSLVVGKFRMVDAELFAKHAAETIGDLCGQCDLRQQKQHLFAFSQGAANEFDVDFGFSTRGDAVQQYHFLFFPPG